MQRKSTLSSKAIDALSTLFESGLNNREIADALGASAACVKYHRTRLGLGSTQLPDIPDVAIVRRGPKRTVRLFTKSEDEVVVSMRIAGSRPTEIARKLNRHPSVISLRLLTLARREAIEEEGHECRHLGMLDV